MYLNNLKKHHLDIYQHIHDLQQYRTAEAVEAHAAELASIVAKTAGLLSIHLAAEDNYLYPSLVQSGDAQVQQTAISFQQEMGSLAQEFSSYKGRFMTPTKIHQSSADFLTATDAIIAALRQRLEREDSKLYPLVQE